MVPWTKTIHACGSDKILLTRAEADEVIEAAVAAQPRITRDTSLINFLLAAAAPAMRAWAEVMYFVIGPGGTGKTTQLAAIVRYWGGNASGDIRALAGTSTASENFNSSLGRLPAVLFDEFRVDDPKIWKQSIAPIRRALIGLPAGAARTIGNNVDEDVLPRAVFYGTSNKVLPLDGGNADNRRFVQIVFSPSHNAFKAAMHLASEYDVWPLVVAGAREWIKRKGESVEVGSYVDLHELSDAQLCAVQIILEKGYVFPGDFKLSRGQWRELGLVSGVKRLTGSDGVSKSYRVRMPDEIKDRRAYQTWLAVSAAVAADSGDALESVSQPETSASNTPEAIVQSDLGQETMQIDTHMASDPETGRDITPEEAMRRLQAQGCGSALLAAGKWSKPTPEQQGGVA